MRFSTAVVTLLTATGALAAVQKVTVGDDGKLAFNPTSVMAEVGDTITFEFKSKNHSVTQSTFDNPCKFKDGGVDSGFRATPANATSFATWSFEINSKDPLWLFCAQTAPAVHCTAGMVFAVNPTAEKSFDNFKATAMSGGSAAPGGNSTASSSGASTASGSSSSGASTATGSSSSGASTATGSSSSGASTATGSSSSGASTATGSASSGASTATGQSSGAAGATGGSGTSTSAANAGDTTSASSSNAALVVSRNSVALLSMASLVLGLTL